MSKPKEKYGIERVIYGDGRVVYQVYQNSLSAGWDGTVRYFKDYICVWPHLSLAAAQVKHLKDSGVISREEVVL